MEYAARPSQANCEGRLVCWDQRMESFVAVIRIKDRILAYPINKIGYVRLPWHRSLRRDAPWMNRSSHPESPGRWIRNLEGRPTFDPNPLYPSFALTPAIQRLITEVEIRLGQLGGMTRVLPDAAILIRSFVRREAQLSSYIENTYARYDERSDVDRGRTSKGATAPGMKPSTPGARFWQVSMRCSNEGRLVNEIADSFDPRGSASRRSRLPVPGANTAISRFTSATNRSEPTPHDLCRPRLI